MPSPTHDNSLEDPLALEVLRFWFGDEPGTRDARWFEKNPRFDDEIRGRFLALHEQAAAGALESWKEVPRECLALVVVLDQFARNMFRDDARAFATDAPALEAAKHALALGYDRSMTPTERMFLYLPYEHSESLADQLTCCELMARLLPYPETADVYRYALAHRAIIERFGRFPHRNAALGRESTPGEIEFLKEPGSSF